MAKRMHTVHMKDPSKKFYAGTISLREIDARIRGPKPPRTQIHRSPADYRRKPKHPSRAWD